MIEKINEYRTQMMTLIRDNDLYDYIIFDNDLKYLIVCNDVFSWGASDVEEVDYDDIDLLKQCFNDIKSIKADDDTYGNFIEYDAFMLFCTRKRKLRPQNEILNAMNSKLAKLIIDETEQRDVGFGNPKELNEKRLV